MKIEIFLNEDESEKVISQIESFLLIVCKKQFSMKKCE